RRRRGREWGAARARPGARCAGSAVAGREREGGVAGGHAGGQTRGDADAVRGVLALQIAGQLVQLGEPAALLVGDEQLDVQQPSRELELDALDQGLDAL